MEVRSGPGIVRAPLPGGGGGRPRCREGAGGEGLPDASVLRWRSWPRSRRPRIPLRVSDGGGMQQHLMEAAAAAAGAPYGTPVPFPVSFHPAYYATHTSMGTSVPYPTAEPVAVSMVEGKSKRKTSGAPSGGCTSGSAGGSENSSDKRDASAHHKVSLPSVKRRKSCSANVQGWHI